MRGMWGRVRNMRWVALPMLACILIIPVWLASALWGAATYYGDGFSVNCVSGEVSLLVGGRFHELARRFRKRNPRAPRFVIRNADYDGMPATWAYRFGLRLPRVNRHLDYDSWVSVPLWSIVLPLGVVIVVLWPATNRAKHAGLCACGYCLRGNVSGCCPECGRQIQAV